MKIMRGHFLFKAVFLLMLAAFPQACREMPRFNYDFEQPAILDKLHWKCGTLFRLAPDHATSGVSSLEVTFYPGPAGVDEYYPGLALTHFNRNWSKYRTLVFDAFLPGEKTIRLGLRIDDREYPDHLDRFNMAIILKPGDNRIAIPFDRIVYSGSKRQLNLKSILEVTLFMGNPKERHTVFFDRLRVE